MKNFSLVAFGICFGIFAKAQIVTYSYSTPAKVIKLSDLTSIDVSQKNTANLPISLEFKISKIPDGVTLTTNVTDKGDGAALLGTDYTYQTDLSKPIALKAVKNDDASKTFTIDFSKAPARKTSANFYVRMQNSGKLDKTYKVTVNFNSSDDLAISQKNPDKITPPDTSKWYLRIVTGGNFDFFNGPTIKSFAGDLTSFIPNVIKIGGLNIGMEFGINNYHYFSSDSSHSEYYNQAYFLHNKDYYSPTNDTAKVVKGTQSINGKYNYNVWGLHTDPLFYIASNDFAQLYIKIHVEELATTVTYTPTLATQ